MRSHFTVCCTIVSTLLLGGCGNKNRHTQEEGITDTLMMSTIITEQDSSIYGTSWQFGMSTFSLITEDKDTLYLERSRPDGTGGKIYGHLREGERYALTVCECHKHIETLINLTQLETFLGHGEYSVLNGRLILTDNSGKPDTAVIKKLTTNEFQAQGKQTYIRNKK